MISDETKQTILTMYDKGCGIRQISRTLKVSKNTVRRVIRGEAGETVVKTSRYEELKPVISDLFKSCRGNVVRIQEIVEEKRPSHSLQHSDPHSAGPGSTRDKTKSRKLYIFPWPGDAA